MCECLQLLELINTSWVEKLHISTCTEGRYVHRYTEVTILLKYTSGFTSPFGYLAPNSFGDRLPYSRPQPEIFCSDTFLHTVQ